MIVKITGTQYHDMDEISESVVLRNAVFCVRDPQYDKKETSKNGWCDGLSYKMECKGVCVGYLPLLRTIRKHVKEAIDSGNKRKYDDRVELGKAVKAVRKQLLIDSDSTGQERWTCKIVGLLYATDTGWDSNPIQAVKFEEYSTLCQEGKQGGLKLRQIAASFPIECF